MNIDKNIETIKYKVVSRVTGLTEVEGSYQECKSYFKRIGFDLSIYSSDEEIWDENGNCNAIESN